MLEVLGGECFEGVEVLGDNVSSAFTLVCRVYDILLLEAYLMVVMV